MRQGMIPRTRRARATLTLCCLLATMALAGGIALARVPSTPLVTHDPFFSVWLGADNPTFAWPVHWTGQRRILASSVRIDGHTWRLFGEQAGASIECAEWSVPAMNLVETRITPTRTIFTSEAEGVRVTLTFLSPLLPGNLELLARPVTYLTWQAQSIDGKEHEVELLYANTAEWVVDQPEQEVAWSREAADGLRWIRLGSKDQALFAKATDNQRIDWGYMLIAAPDDAGTSATVAALNISRAGFKEGNPLPALDERQPRPAKDQWPSAVFTFKLGKVGAEPVSRWLMLAYHDLYSIKYFGENLRGWYRREGGPLMQSIQGEPSDAAVETALLRAAAADYPEAVRQSEAFDGELTADMTTLGGERYAALCALAHRHGIASGKVVASPKGQPFFFNKECFSGGMTGTVDVIYPMLPQFLLLSPELAWASIEPVFEYAASGRWKFPFAPHDLGVYPEVRGQHYGGGEKEEVNQMQVEETGNMLLMTAALAEARGDAEFALPHWEQLTRWADYLRQKGFDPEEQLCTDDFTGHLAHNVNLSAKAICALGAFVHLGRVLGKDAELGVYEKSASEFAARWITQADDGSHYRLAFDKPGTWSQKYNLVWNRILDLKLFPREVIAKELAFYATVQQPYGLPLDNRALFTKTDWLVWTATLAPTREGFDALMAPLYRFLEETPDRVPLTDLYYTNDATQWRYAPGVGFQARPVIGGVFIKALSDPELWHKWSRAGELSTAD